MSHFLSIVGTRKVFEHLVHHHGASSCRTYPDSLVGTGRGGLLDAVLLTFGEALSWNEDDSEYVLRMAIHCGYPMALIARLIELGAVPGESHMETAVERGRIDLLLPLLEHFQEKRRGTQSRRQMFDLFACRDACKVPRIYHVLLPHCSEPDARYLLMGCLEAMRKSHWRCWSVDSRDTLDSNPAMELLRDIIDRIVLQGKGEDAESVLAEGLLAAVRWAPLSVVRVLIEEGKADVNARRTKKGKTALILVAKKGRPEDMLRYLLQAEADPDIRDDAGWNAFTLAIKKCHHHLVAILLPLAQNEWTPDSK